jgi:hypothetical protein
MASASAGAIGVYGPFEVLNAAASRGRRGAVNAGIVVSE